MSTAHFSQAISPHELERTSLSMNIATCYKWSLATSITLVHDMMHVARLKLTSLRELLLRGTPLQHHYPNHYPTHRWVRLLMRTGEWSCTLALSSSELAASVKEQLLLNWMTLTLNTWAASVQMTLTLHLMLLVAVLEASFAVKDNNQPYRSSIDDLDFAQWNCTLLFSTMTQPNDPYITLKALRCIACS